MVFFNDNLAFSVLIIAQILQILNKYSSISFDSNIIGDIVKTLYIDNFRWSSNNVLFNTDYEFRRGFIVRIIECNLYKYGWSTNGGINAFIQLIPTKFI